MDYRGIIGDNTDVQGDGGRKEHKDRQKWKHKEILKSREAKASFEKDRNTCFAQSMPGANTD